jgi:hypothetical protein
MMKAFTQSHARDREKFYATLKAHEAETGHSIGDHEKFPEFAASENYTVTQQSKGYNLLLTFQSCIPIAKTLEGEYKHDIFYAPADSFFLTCDNPIVTIEPDSDGTAWVGMGVGRPRTEIIFPVNKRACIILRRGGESKQLTATPFRMRQINDMIMGAAQKYAYAPVGHRRLSRIFNERGCKIKYGDNAFSARHPTRG